MAARSLRRSVDGRPAAVHRPPGRWRPGLAAMCGRPLKNRRRATSEAMEICLFRDCTSVAKGRSKSGSPARPALRPRPPPGDCGRRPLCRAVASGRLGRRSLPARQERRACQCRSGRAATIADRSLELRASSSAARTRVASAVCEVIGQVLGGQRVAVGQFVPGKQSSEAQLVRQVRLRLEQGPRFAGRDRRIEGFQRRQRELLELVIVAAHPVDQHRHSPIVTQAAQCPGDRWRSTGARLALAGGGQEERQALLAPHAAKWLDLGLERLPGLDRLLQASQQDPFGAGAVEPDRRASISRFARRLFVERQPGQRVQNRGDRLRVCDPRQCRGRRGPLRVVSAAVSCAINNSRDQATLGLSASSWPRASRAASRTCVTGFVATRAPPGVHRPRHRAVVDRGA